MGERTLGTSFQKSTVATARLEMPSGVNSNFCRTFQQSAIQKFGRTSESYLVDVLVRARGTEAVDAELLVGVPLPAHGAHDLNGQRGNTVGKDGEPVLLGLEVEDLEAGHRDDADLEVVLLLELLGGINADADLGTGGDKGDVGTLLLVKNVTTLGGLLDGRTLKLRKVLAGEGDDAGGVVGGESGVVAAAGLVTVGRAPDHAVGEGTEVGESLDRLVGRAVLTETDGVVGGDPDDALAGESGQTDGTSGV